MGFLNEFLWGFRYSLSDGKDPGIRDALSGGYMTGEYTPFESSETGTRQCREFSSVVCTDDTCKWGKFIENGGNET